MIVPPGDEFSVAKLVDLESLLLTARGRERTEPELRQVVEAAGLEILDVVETDSPVSIVEAR
jgi:hypothetical protein